MSDAFSPQPPMPSPYPLPGEVLDGKYQIERMLGEGGMGAVAKATHLLRRAPVALKFMSPMVMSMPGAVERFINEGVAASQIDSDHVVKIYDVNRLPSGAPYLVMEFLEGRDLADILEREGKPGLDISRCVHFTLQILRGLQVAHSVGIIHRDMKPANCFVVSKEGEADFVKLVDFGISKVDQPGGGRVTRTHSALGTPLYMSPEQARSPRGVDARTDLYSVGVLMFELLTGRTPYHSESGEFTEILYKIFTADPPPIQSFRPDIPDGLAAIVHRALARDVDSRFADAVHMAEALVPWADGRSYAVVQRVLAARGASSRVLSVHPGPGQVVPAAATNVIAGGEHRRVVPTAPDGRDVEANGPTFAGVPSLPTPPRVPTFSDGTLPTGRSVSDSTQLAHPSLPPAKIQSVPPASLGRLIAVLAASIFLLAFVAVLIFAGFRRTNGGTVAAPSSSASASAASVAPIASAPPSAPATTSSPPVATDAAPPPSLPAPPAKDAGRVRPNPVVPGPNPVVPGPNCDPLTGACN